MVLEEVRAINVQPDHECYLIASLTKYQKIPRFCAEKYALTHAAVSMSI